MIRRVIVPLDGSRLAETVLDPAVRLVEAEKGTLLLLHAVTPAESFSMTASDFITQERRRAAEYLEKLSGRFESKEIGIQIRVLNGEASKVIVAAGREEKADLIAMSTHGRSGVREWAFGSVAERVLRATRLPVLVFRGQPVKSFAIRRILVALDGAESSLDILPVVRSVAASLKAEVKLLHVGKHLPMTVETAMTSLRQAHISFHTRLVQGDPAASILAAAAEEQADVLALTTSGKTPNDRLFFGSVAEDVLRKADRPLLVVRAPSGE